MHIKRKFHVCVLLMICAPTSGISCRSLNRPAAPPGVSETHDVVIVGAGIAGLSAGYFLKDLDVQILEKSSRIGGRADSGTYQGINYAMGAEYLGRPQSALRTIVNGLGMTPREIPSPMDASIRGDGQIFWGDEGRDLMFTTFGGVEAYNRLISVVADLYQEYEDVPDFDPNSDLADLDSITVRQWLEREGFSAFFAERFNVMARGIFGANIDEISALCFISELGFDMAGQDLIDDPASLSNQPDPNDHSEAYTFNGGLTTLTNRLAANLGTRIQLDTTVTEVSQLGDWLLVSSQNRSGLASVVGARVVILAAPAPIALKLAGSVLTAKQKEIMGQIQYAPYATVALFTDQAIFDRAFDLSVPDGLCFTDLYDSTWVDRHLDASVASKSFRVLGAYASATSFRDTAFSSLSDDQLLQRVYADLDKVFPGASGRVTGHDIRRYPYAYPVMTLGAYRRLTELHAITNGPLQLAGDYMVYPTFEAAADSGRLAASKARAQLSK